MKVEWTDMSELDNDLDLWGLDGEEQRLKVKDFYKEIYGMNVSLYNILFNRTWNRGYVYTNY